MDITSLRSRLDELVKEVGGQNKVEVRKLSELAKEAEAKHKKLTEGLDSLQESIDYLRVCIKYQLFDLEATRRENSFLRKLLEED